MKKVYILVLSILLPICGIAKNALSINCLNSFKLSYLFAFILLVGCMPLQQVLVMRVDKIENYKYFYITPTNRINSSTGAVYGNQYGVYGGSKSKSINPSELISGVLLKEGFLQTPELRPELINETLIINYGESGRRPRGFGYTIEVTIQFLSAKTNAKVCSCSAEGQGETEVDDIRMAINRCLSGVMDKGSPVY